MALLNPADSVQTLNKDLLPQNETSVTDPSVLEVSRNLADLSYLDLGNAEEHLANAYVIQSNPADIARKHANGEMLELSMTPHGIEVYVNEAERQYVTEWISYNSRESAYLREKLRTEGKIDDETIVLLEKHNNLAQLWRVISQIQGGKIAGKPFFTNLELVDPKMEFIKDDLGPIKLFYNAKTEDRERIKKYTDIYIDIYDKFIKNRTSANDEILGICAPDKICRRNGAHGNIFVVDLEGNDSPQIFLEETVHASLNQSLGTSCSGDLTEGVANLIVQYRFPESKDDFPIFYGAAEAMYIDDNNLPFSSEEMLNNQPAHLKDKDVYNDEYSYRYGLRLGHAVTSHLVHQGYTVEDAINKYIDMYAITAEADLYSTLDHPKYPTYKKKLISGWNPVASQSDITKEALISIGINPEDPGFRKRLLLHLKSSKPYDIGEDPEEADLN